MSSQWYILRSKPNKEVAPWRELGARGLDCFYPQMHVQPVNLRSRKARPYFPGYVADRDLNFQWMPVSSGFVSFGGTPATVPDCLIQLIQQRVDEINAAAGEHLTSLKRGDVVLIEGGPFDGYEAIFDTRIPGRERVRLFLNLLEVQQMNLEIPVVQIRQRKRQ